MQRQILISVMIFFAYALNLPLNTQRPHHRSQRSGKLGLDFGSWQSPDISRSHLYRGTFPWTPPTAIYRAYTVLWYSAKSTQLFLFITPTCPGWRVLCIWRPYIPHVSVCYSIHQRCYQFTGDNILFACFIFGTNIGVTINRNHIEYGQLQLHLHFLLNLMTLVPYSKCSSCEGDFDLWSIFLVCKIPAYRVFVMFCLVGPCSLCPLLGRCVMFFKVSEILNMPSKITLAIVFFLSKTNKQTDETDILMHCNFWQMPGHLQSKCYDIDQCTL